LKIYAVSQNYNSSLIFFVYWVRGRLPAGRQRKPKRPNINLAPNIFLSFLLTGKVADNHKSELQIQNRNSEAQILHRSGEGMLGKYARIRDLLFVKYAQTKYAIKLAPFLGISESVVVNKAQKKATPL
jgi:hypothetical protein